MFISFQAVDEGKYVHESDYFNSLLYFILQVITGDYVNYEANVTDRSRTCLIQVSARKEKLNSKTATFENFLTF